MGQAGASGVRRRADVRTSRCNGLIWRPFSAGGSNVNPLDDLLLYLRDLQQGRILELPLELHAVEPRPDLRPPLADDRLTLLDDGKVVLRLRHPRKDGTVAIVLPADELICRMAALVQRPFKNGYVFWGVLAANSSLRAEVVPGGRKHPEGGGRACRRIPFQELAIRTLGVDPLRCACGETYVLLAEIRDPVVVRAILASLNLPTDPLPITRARPPPDEDVFDWAA